MSETKFYPVSAEDFQVGKLSERNLFLHLPSNNRYVLVCSALHPVDESAINKMRKSGRIFSDQETVVERFENFNSTVYEVEELCRTQDREQELTSFEFGKKLMAHTLWLADHVFYPEVKFDPIPVVMFMNACFKVPKTSALLCISDLSIDVYERAIIRSCVSGLVCLWKGYHSYEFIKNWVETIFVESISEANQVANMKKESPVALLKGGAIPEYTFQMDYFFESIISQHFEKKELLGDLEEILMYTDFLMEKRIYTESFQINRVVRTINQKIKMAEERRDNENKERAKVA